MRSIAEDNVWVRVEVVHEHGGSGDGVGRWGGLFGCDFVECWENTGIACAAIIHEGAIVQFLNELVESEDASFFEAVHATTDFEVGVAIAGDGNGVAVVVPDFFWNDGWSDAYVLEV